jgi:uncharacterized repeat protein (TIGR01451 family)
MTLATGNLNQEPVRPTFQADAATISPDAAQIVWPRWRRLMLIAAATLILCSCRALPPSAEPVGPPDVVATDHFAPPPGVGDARRASPALPSQVAPNVLLASHEGEIVARDDDTFGDASVVPASHIGHHSRPAPSTQSPPQPNSLAFAQYGPPQVPWSPPGIRGPWPRDEYLHDGGDHGTPVGVRPDWSVVGLEEEDTVGMYDTLDGRTIIQPSNRVSIYAPRFGVVRRVDDIHGHLQNIATDGINRDLALADGEFTARPTTSLQRVQLKGDHLARGLTEYEAQLHQVGLDSAARLLELDGPLRAHEDFSMIRHGRFNRDEAAALSEAILAAQAWRHDEQVKVFIDEVAATAVVGEISSGVIYSLAEPQNPRLRVVKTASTAAAQVGDYVDFTIRYDNIGNQVMGNVVLVDSLTTRLEYVPDSAQSSHDANFIVEPNTADSVTLRWEIQQPIEAGEGGMIRFRCLVR